MHATTLFGKDCDVTMPTHMGLTVDVFEVELA
jgi:hypothetical protein